MRCTRPVVAPSATVGSGGEIAMSCDFIVAANDTSFTFPRRIGAVGATAATVIGVSRARLLFTGREMPVAPGHALGMVARLVEPAQ